ncbi:MAG: ThuA domain-containing protein [Verrucomicrobia bacterium]|nr:ThuA domain-containing protein [Verrucomicrobiota bacterium]
MSMYANRRPRSFAFTCRTPLALALAVAVTLPLPLPVAHGATPKKVLVVTITSGFRHGPAIDRLEATLPELGRDSGAFTVDFCRVEPNDPQFKDPATGKPDQAKVKAAIQQALARQLSVAALREYDGVIFANTSGEMPLPDLPGLLEWIKGGKAFIGIHAATDSLRSGQAGKPTPYTTMIGAAFKSHGAQATVECINQDPSHPACQPVPARWTVHDEIYLFTDFDRSAVHGLLTLDREPNSKAPGDYPIAWCKEYGRGRVFFTSLGHREDVIDPAWGSDADRKNSRAVAQVYQQHLLGGIRWALGTPSGESRPAGR